jgi:uncharacterized protein YggE
MKHLLLLFICLLVSGKKFRPYPPAHADPTTGDSQLTLTESASIPVATTYTQVSLTVSVKSNFGSDSRDEVIERVMNQASNATQAVGDYVQSQEGVIKFHTTGLTVSTISRWDNDAGVSTDVGYQATNSVSFQVKNSNAGSVIAGVVKNGSPYTSVDSVNFIACDDDILDGQKQAVKNALVAAQNQAKFVLDTLGLCLDHIVNVNLNKGDVSGPIPMPYAMGAKSASFAADIAPVPVSGGDQDVSASVTMTVAFKDCDPTAESDDQGYYSHTDGQRRKGKQRY